MVVLCLSGPVDLQGERQTGKASPHKPLSLSLGGKSLPEVPGVLTTHWPELCHVTTIATKEAGKMNTCSEEQ